MRLEEALKASHESPISKARSATVERPNGSAFLVMEWSDGTRRGFRMSRGGKFSPVRRVPDAENWTPGAGLISGFPMVARS